MKSPIPSNVPRPKTPQHTVDFDVGDPEVIEQSSFEIEEITLTGEHQVITETELVADITISGEHKAVDE